MHQDLKPGRELDRLIAEKVMGYLRLEDGWDPLTSQPFERWEYGDGKYAGIPSYSTDIAAAWQVVERAKVESLIRIEGGKWVAKTVSNYPEDDEGNEQEAWPRLDDYYETSLYRDAGLSIGDTAPHAICLAALKACGVNGGEG